MAHISLHIPMNYIKRDKGRHGLSEIWRRLNPLPYSPPEVDRIWGRLLWLYRDNGKENGNYYIITGCILGL